MNNMAPTRPILRYHGGKWRLAPWIISHFPTHRVYVEPFGGAASVLLRKDRAYAEVYNDLDQDVVNLFKVAREQGEELIRQLRLMPYSYAVFSETFCAGGTDMDRAVRLVCRSFMGFGSNAHARPTGFRANSNRSGTTPAHDWANYPDSLAATIERLRGVIIECRPALQIVQQHDSAETLHYLDPPYVAATRDAGADYKFEMSDQAHERMLEDVQQLQGMVAISGCGCDLYFDHLGDWTAVSQKAFADGARERTEWLWLNPALTENLGKPKQINMFEVPA